jgi:hypothetical protein
MNELNIELFVYLLFIDLLLILLNINKQNMRFVQVIILEIGQYQSR